MEGRREAVKAQKTGRELSACLKSARLSPLEQEEVGKRIRSLFSMLVTFGSFVLTLLSLFSSRFCQAPSAGLLMRQGERLLFLKIRALTLSLLSFFLEFLVFSRARNSLFFEVLSHPSRDFKGLSGTNALRIFSVLPFLVFDNSSFFLFSARNSLFF